MKKEEFSSPSRKGLILGAVLVALHGFRNEAVARARAYGDTNWNEHPDVLESKRIAAGIRTGASVEVSHERVRDLLAHTRQIMRISLEEWDEAVAMIKFPDNETATKEIADWPSSGLRARAFDFPPNRL